MNANGRRQRQAKNGYNHLTPRQRPNYKMRDIATSMRHEQRLRATENRIRQGKKK
jgi:hypothetical protein